MFKKSLLLFFTLLLTCTATMAVELKFNGFVADNAQVISDETTDNINSFLWELHEKTGADIAVVALPTLDGDKPNDVALKIKNSYKLGDKVKDNGVVLLVAPYDKIINIQISSKLKKEIGASVINDIKKLDILPYLQNEQYEEGIYRGAYLLAVYIAQADNVFLTEQKNIPPRTIHPHAFSGFTVFDGFVICIIFLIFSVKIAVRRMIIGHIVGTVTGARSFGRKGSFGRKTGMIGVGFGDTNPLVNSRLNDIERINERW